MASRSSNKRLSRTTQRGNKDVLRIVSLITGDIIVFLIFAIVGRDSHAEATGLSAIGPTFMTALPFLIAWFVISPFLGAYKRDNFTNWRLMLKRTLLAWLIAWPVAVLIRAAFNGYIPPYTFWIVAFLSNVIVLLVWRLPFAMTNELKDREAVQRSSADQP